MVYEATIDFISEKMQQLRAGELGRRIKYRIKSEPENLAAELPTDLYISRLSNGRKIKLFSQALLRISVFGY
jgi:hypothetical protein